MDRIAVLIPCLNEAPTIAKVVTDFRTQLPEAVIYVYDNNCTDETAELAKKAGAVVRREKHQGKGNVIRRMFREIDAECYLMVDGDDTYEAGDAWKLCDPVLSGDADMVVGDRLSGAYFTENRRPFHNFGNKLVRNRVAKRFGGDIRDVMTGYRAFSYRFVKTAPVLSRGFEVETEMTIHAIDKNLQVENAVIGYRDRPEGSFSKLNTYSDGWKVLRTIDTYYRICNPKRYFGRRAGLGVIAAVLFLTVFFLNRQNTGNLQAMALLLLSSLCLVLSMLFKLGERILDAEHRENLKNFDLAFASAEDEFQRKCKTE